MVNILRDPQEQPYPIGSTDPPGNYPSIIPELEAFSTSADAFLALWCVNPVKN